MQILGMFVVFALAIFLPAGTMAWTAGWVYLSIFFIFTITISIVLLKSNPGLLQERMTGLARPDEKAWDRALMVLIAVVFFAWLVFMPLDAVRFHWSQMPLWIQIAGAAILLCSLGFFFGVYRENPYLSPAVRVQQDRGQTVISTGPYGYVRHPLYSAFCLFVPGTSLLLGSWYGLLFGLILIVLVARRAVLEERTLLNELKGYDTYMAKVKYRLIPYIW